MTLAFEEYMDSIRVKPKTRPRLVVENHAVLHCDNCGAEEPISGGRLAEQCSLCYGWMRLEYSATAKTTPTRRDNA